MRLSKDAFHVIASFLNIKDLFSLSHTSSSFLYYSDSGSRIQILRSIISNKNDYLASCVLAPLPDSDIKDFLSYFLYFPGDHYFELAIKEAVKKSNKTIFKYILSKLTSNYKLDANIVLPSAMEKPPIYYFNKLLPLCDKVSWINGLSFPGLNYYLLATEAETDPLAAIKFIQYNLGETGDRINIMAIENAKKKCSDECVALLKNIFPATEFLTEDSHRSNIDFHKPAKKPRVRYTY
jgi:hypothetical protein